ncbi:MAG TPA: hypothetical protein VJZ27_02020 [Aggregatilineales bacterium]|nr:hypothetical protein [Aggregatilineales bacterium]
MEKRYSILRIISAIYKFVGVILLILTLLSSAGACLLSIAGGAALNDIIEEAESDEFGRSNSDSGLAEASALGGMLLSVGVLLYGGFISLAVYGTGEAIQVFLSIEENTRATSLLMRRQVKQQNTGSLVE